MSNGLDLSACVAVINISVDVSSLLWPVKVLANEFQSSCLALVFCDLRIMVVS